MDDRAGFEPTDHTGPELADSTENIAILNLGDSEDDENDEEDEDEQKEEEDLLVWKDQRASSQRTRKTKPVGGNRRSQRTRRKPEVYDPHLQDVHDKQRKKVEKEREQKKKRDRSEAQASKHRPRVARYLLFDVQRLQGHQGLRRACYCQFHDTVSPRQRLLNRKVVQLPSRKNYLAMGLMRSPVL